MALAGMRSCMASIVTVAFRGAGGAIATPRAYGTYATDAGAAELRAAVLEFDDSLPRARAVAPPVAWYAQHSIHSLEATAVFGSRWVGVGSAQRVSAPGAFFTGTIGNEPYLIVNDGSKINAFYNVCPHRGSLLVRATSGTTTSFACHSSGRTYSLDGRLASWPCAEQESLADTRAFSTTADRLGHAAIARYGPALLVHLLQPENPNVIASCGSDVTCQAANEAQASYLRTVEFRASSNWKLIVENYLNSMRGSGRRLRHDLYFPDRRCNKPPLLPTEASHGSPHSVQPNSSIYIYPNVLIDSGNNCTIVRYIIPVDARNSLIEADYFSTSEEAAGGDSGDDEISTKLIGHDFVETQKCIKVCEEDQKAMYSKRVQSLRKHAAMAENNPGIREFHIMLADDLKEALQLKFDVTI